VYYTQLEQEISAKGLPVGDYIVGGAAEDSVLQSFTSNYVLSAEEVRHASNTLQYFSLVYDRQECDR
jgi:hypothetical protein